MDAYLAVVWWFEIEVTWPWRSKQCLPREPAQLLAQERTWSASCLSTLTCHVACRMVTVLLGGRGVLYFCYRALPARQHRDLQGEKVRLVPWALSVAAVGA